MVFNDEVGKLCRSHVFTTAQWFEKLSVLVEIQNNIT